MSLLKRVILKGKELFVTPRISKSCYISVGQHTVLEEETFIVCDHSGLNLHLPTDLQFTSKSQQKYKKEEILNHNELYVGNFYNQYPFYAKYKLFPPLISTFRTKFHKKKNIFSSNFFLDFGFFLFLSS